MGLYIHKGREGSLAVLEELVTAAVCLAMVPSGHRGRKVKYRPTREYWNDFVFEAYVNYGREAIYLAGLPDVPESRPHSEVNHWGFGDDSATKR